MRRYILIGVWLILNLGACWTNPCLAQVGQVEQGVVTPQQEIYNSFPNTQHFLPRTTGFPWKMIVTERSLLYTGSLVTFPSPVESSAVCNNTVYGEYFWPEKKGRSPAVVVLHIAGGDFELFRFISRQLVSRGIAALFLHMAYYGYRRPQDNPRLRMLSEDIDLTFSAVRQTVMDVRRAALWLSLRREVDGQKLGIVGASLGALVGSLVAGVEPRFTKSALVVGGGDLGKILWESTLTARTRKNLESRGFTLESLRAKMKGIDPLTYAANVNPRGVLMINSRYDTIIPIECTNRLWEALGRPRILWYEADHVRILLYLPDVLQRVAEHFASENWGEASR